jgi:hypothetical protein
MNQPRFPEFRPIGLEDKTVVESFISRHPSEACEVNFGNIFLWRNFERPKFTFIHGNLCILCAPPSEPAYFLQPVGGNRIEETIEKSSPWNLAAASAVSPTGTILTMSIGLKI